MKTKDQERRPIGTTGEILVVIKGKAPDKSRGGIITAETGNKRPAWFGRVVARGPDCKTVEVGEIIVFDPREAIEDVRILSETFDPIDFVYVPERSVLNRMSQGDALQLGIPVPNCGKNDSGTYLFAQLCGAIG